MNLETLKQIATRDNGKSKSTFNQGWIEGETHLANKVMDSLNSLELEKTSEKKLKSLSTTELLDELKARKDVLILCWQPEDLQHLAKVRLNRRIELEEINYFCEWARKESAIFESSSDDEILANEIDIFFRQNNEQEFVKGE